MSVKLLNHSILKFHLGTVKAIESIHLFDCTSVNALLVSQNNVNNNTRKLTPDINS